VTLRLVRPENVVPPEEDEASSAATRKRLHLMGPAENIGLSRPDGKQAPQAGSAPRRPTAWTAASSSVPTLKRSAPLMPESRFDRIQEGEPEQEMSSPKEGLGSTDIEEPSPKRPSAPTVHLAPLEESPWVVAMDALMHNTQLQIGIGVAVLLILTWTFWPRSESNASVSSIQHHPERYDGKMVRVQGKIGDVYAIGGGYTYYLLSGRDTMVVFTRTRVPVTDEHISVRGTISTGYLDGVPRQALFEDGKQ
jgi:membrane protein implicated in regulation of membrane protease activity